MAHSGLKGLFNGILTETELKELPTSFDVVGDIMIFAEFPSSLFQKEKEIGKSILESYSNIKVVCKKIKKYGGLYRTPTLRIVAGARRKKTEHKENGIRLRLDVEKVYFSARLAHERERINKIVRNGENVLVMFSGIGVYPINISKNTKAKSIMGIEINPLAHEYAQKNLLINKVKNVELHNADVNKMMPQMHEKFDRILMPLPKSAEDFLDIAITHLVKGGTLHYYSFLHENEFNLAKQEVAEHAKCLKRKLTKSSLIKCGQYGTRKYRVCLDAKIE